MTGEMGNRFQMQRYVAFLRGINVGKRRVAMSRLVEIFERLGHTEVATFIASGNVIFSSRSRNLQTLERRSSQELSRSLGYEVEVFVRRSGELLDIAKSEMFRPHESMGAAVHVGFMRDALDQETREAFEAVRTAVDSFKVIDREFYWICYTKISESKVWELPDSKKLSLPSNTLRNMSTVRRIVAKHFSG